MKLFGMAFVRFSFLNVIIIDHNNLKITITILQVNIGDLNYGLGYLNNGKYLSAIQLPFG